jgi:general secretion pathway protein K
MKLKKAKNQKAFVLIVVLGMIMALTVLLLGFSHKARNNLTTADQFLKSRQALNCAKAGLNIAIAAVKENPDIQTNEKLKKLLSGQKRLSIGQGDCAITVTSENGKINVNMLKDENATIDRTRTDQLLRLIELLNKENRNIVKISHAIVPCIMDWTDTDDKVTQLPFVKNANTGAESTYYRQLDNPYKCSNTPLNTTEQLLSVKDITPEIYELLRDHVTVYGDGKININNASKLVIQSLSEHIDPVLAQMIVERQKYSPADHITQLQDLPGINENVYNKIKKVVTVNSTGQYYRVESQGMVNQIERTVTAIIKRDTETKNVEVIIYKEV